MSEIKPYHNYENVVAPYRKLIAKGLVSGLGQPHPGKLCIEAARRLVMGLPHGDEADDCVGNPDRALAIGLNDAPWSSDMARAAGLADFAVAHLGSAKMSPEARSRWAKYIAEQTIRRVLPLALDAIGLRVEAQRCRQEGTTEAAWAAAKAAGSANVAWVAGAEAGGGWRWWGAVGVAVWTAARAAAKAEEAGTDAPLIESAKIAVEAYTLVREVKSE